jgi:hypothetical protein
MTTINSSLVITYTGMGNDSYMKFCKTGGGRVTTCRGAAKTIKKTS